MKKFAMYLLAGLFFVPLLGILTLRRVCGHSAPGRGRSCTPEQVIEFLAGITTLQWTVLGVVALYVTVVVWLWKRKPPGSADRAP